MAKEDMITRHQVISMPLAAWRILGEYITVVDYDRKGRGKSNVSYTVVAGAILSRFLIDHAHEIRRASETVRLAAIREAIPAFYSPSQLAAISSATGADIPVVYRIGRYKRAPAGKAEARRTLQHIAAGSKGTATGLAGKPRKVRRRRSNTGSRAVSGQPKPG